MSCSMFDGEAHVVSEDGNDSVGDRTRADILYIFFSVQYVNESVRIKIFNCSI